MESMETGVDKANDICAKIRQKHKKRGLNALL
jgi:hypothetical protein